MQTIAPLFEVEDEVIARPRRQVGHPVIAVTEDDLTGIAGVALWGELLDRLGLIAEADRRVLRPIGPDGYSGGECYLAVVETQLAGGDVFSDRPLLAGEATQRLRGAHALASGTTPFRFHAGAGLSRATKDQAVNATMLRRAWAMGAGQGPRILTIDPDATYLDTYGPSKEGSRFSDKGKVQMSTLVGVVSETGDVLAIRARDTRSRWQCEPAKEARELRRRVRGCDRRALTLVAPAVDPGRLGRVLAFGDRRGDRPQCGVLDHLRAGQASPCDLRAREGPRNDLGAGTFCRG